MATEARQTIRKYVAASLHYLENALVLLQKEEPAKAGELLWGSTAQAIQALAASRGRLLTNHRSLRWFITTLAKERNDRTLVDNFRRAEYLHSNFHEVDLSVEDVALDVDSIRELVNSLLSLIPTELVRES